MPVMRIESGTGAYEVRFLETLGELRDHLPSGRRLWVVDQRVWELYGQAIRAAAGEDPILPVAIHEDFKQLDTVQELCASLLAFGVRRQSTLVAVGGGILQDLAGFAASILFRGIPWVFVPTTLLAQADSCIGGKTSLNFQAYKNLLGTFWPPRRVLLCPAFLDTLEEDDYYSGLGEVLKLHFMGGLSCLEAYESLQPGLRARDGQALLAAIRNSLGVKQGYIERDEHDGGPRLLLNFGHCFGHALEAASAFRIPHGQAVVAGMALANRVSVARGLLEAGLAQRVERLIRDTLVVPPLASELEPGPFLAAMGRDKKRTGQGLALILMKSGLAFEQVQDLSEREAVSVLGGAASALGETTPVPGNTVPAQGGAASAPGETTLVPGNTASAHGKPAFHA